MDKKITVSDAELEIMEVLWSAGRDLNAGEIRNILNENKNWERTTVLTLINRLVKKEVVRQEKREVFYYLPCISREEYVREETKSFVNKFFKGSSRNLAAALVNNESLTKEDVEELRNYFNENL
ncbi:MAG: BlaI/MecI/CopY family transcriptional regulator [Lachnospiraceae bacterium]|nr:BlaI/MecI/CopY family transcriptional regulator [Lachnospiraceae bacterium]